MFRLSLVSCALISGILLADPPTAEEVAQRAAAIRPSTAELAWSEIPWLTDLGAAQRIAKTEKRPLLVWAVADSPLERC